MVIQLQLQKSKEKLRKTRFIILTGVMDRRHMVHREKHWDARKQKQEQWESIRQMLLLLRKHKTKIQFRIGYFVQSGGL